MAIVHDYLNQYGGAERVLDIFMNLYPNSSLFTLYYDKRRYTMLSSLKLRTTFVQFFPKIKNHKFYFPFFPFAVKTFTFAR